MKTFAIGDIHGNYKSLKQVIKESKIDKENDTLIVLGDVVDGYPDVVKVIDELLTFKNLIGILGNHDFWCRDFLEFGTAVPQWLAQGGQNTFDDYLANSGKQEEHLNKYFKKLVPYYHDTEKNHVYTHGGFNWHLTLKQNSLGNFLWDRHMVETAQTWQANHDFRDMELLKFPNFDTIFVGHTSTQIEYDYRYQSSTYPAFLSNLINLDTGAGWKGKLTIMDVDTTMYWQSDYAAHYYPKDHAREQ